MAMTLGIEENDNEERMFRSGMEGLRKAFIMRKEKMLKVINEQDANVSRMELKIEEMSQENGRLKEENERLREENEGVKNDCKELKEQKMKLINSLEANQSKLQMIKKSIVENNTYGSGNNTVKGNNTMGTSHNNNNTQSNCNTVVITTTGNNANANLIKQDMFQLYKKTAMVTPIQIQQPIIDTSSNNNYLTMRSNTINNNHYQQTLNTNNNTQPLLMNNETPNKTMSNYTMTNNNKYSHIESRLNNIKGNFTTREINPYLNNKSLALATPVNLKSQHLRANSNHNSATNITKTLAQVINTNTLSLPQQKTQIQQQQMRVSTPSNKGNKIKEKILQGARIAKESAERNNRPQNYSHRSNRYELTNQFLNECNLRLDPQDFEKILMIFQGIKEGEIGDEEGKERIKEFIANNVGLIKMIDSVFQ